MDVGDWLRSLGLGQYEALFRESEIDAEVLPDLGDSDLEKLAVPLGHRKRLLKAIARLAVPTAAAVVEAAPLAPPRGDSAERRQLTVMFCDLVGSTALSSRLDPEDMRVVIRAYQDACSAVVARYDGFVAKFMGDGVLAYFGYPHAHEDDAERAVRAGLEIAAAIAKLETRAKDELTARIGIATGLVVVGDLIGTGSAQEQAVVGDTPNLAARLQALAEPGSIVIAASTRRLLGDLFKLRDLGRHAVKGLVEPVEAWSVEGVSINESRFEAAHTVRLTGFVGREAESMLLLESQRQAFRGEGQIVLVSGEAGIGKSRLSARLAEQIRHEPHIRLRYQCSAYHRDSALYPFVQQLERAAGIAPEEDPERKLEKLEAILGQATARTREIAPLIASLLSISLGGRYPALGLSPAQQRRQTFSALLDQMEGLARRKSVLMLFEDAHWADATSLELLDLAIERVRHLPVLLLITFRPEFEATWKGLPDVTTVTLGRLDRGEVENLVERVTGGRKLPTEVMAQIVAKTDGIPLFVEELTKNVLESGLLKVEGDCYRLDGALPPLAIPSTLQDSLMARLDRLSTVKEVAQIGAAIGREFTYALLNEVVGRDQGPLRSALAQLEDAELIFRTGSPPDARYRFKHALVQDTAYETLLKSRRQVLHRRIAETLLEKFPNIAAAEPELVAHHFTQAGLTEIAVEYWGKAGDIALRRFAFKEAIAHLSTAIEISDKLPVDASSKLHGRARLRLQVVYANAYLHSQGPGAPQTTAAFARARELAVGIEETPDRFSAYYGLWTGHFVRGSLAQAREVTDSMVRDFHRERGSQDDGLIQRAIGMTCHAAGDYLDARRHLEDSVASYIPERDRGTALRFGVDTGVASNCFLAHVTWALGEVASARRLSDQAISLAQSIKHIPTLAYAHGMVAMLDAVRPDPAAALSRAQATLSWSNEHGMPLYRAIGSLCRGWARSRAQDREAGIVEMREGVKLVRAQVWSLLPLALLLLADAEFEAGQVEQAVAAIDDALSAVREAGLRGWAPLAYCVRGNILFKRDPSNPKLAEEAFLAAIAMAQGQMTRSFELRAAFGLAKLYQATNRNADAHAVLAPAVKGLSATPELLEIAQAQTLLVTLNR